MPLATEVKLLTDKGTKSTRIAVKTKVPAFKAQALADINRALDANRKLKSKI